MGLTWTSVRDTHFGDQTRSCFCRRGWQGLAIEANPKLVGLYRRKRPRDEVLHAVAADYCGESEFFMFSAWQLSSCNRDWADRVTATGQVPSTVSVKTISLSSLRLAVTPADNTFLSIDVEGADLQVLSGIDWSVFRPRLICVEDAEDSSPIGELIKSHGYVKRAQLVVSSIWLHESQIAHR